MTPLPEESAAEEDVMKKMELAAARRRNMYDLFNAVQMRDKEPVHPIESTWKCKGYEVIGETSTQFVMWKWDGPGQYVHEKMPKHEALDVAYPLMPSGPKTNEDAPEPKPPAPTPVELPAITTWNKLKKLFFGE